MRSDLSAVDYTIIYTRFNCKDLWIGCYTLDKYLDTGHMLLPAGSEGFVYVYAQQGFKIIHLLKKLYNDLLHINANLITFAFDQLSNFFSTE